MGIRSSACLIDCLFCRSCRSFGMDLEMPERYKSFLRISGLGQSGLGFLVFRRLFQTGWMSLGLEEKSLQKKESLCERSTGRKRAILFLSPFPVWCLKMALLISLPH